MLIKYLKIKLWNSSLCPMFLLPKHDFSNPKLILLDFFLILLLQLSLDYESLFF